MAMEGVKKTRGSDTHSIDSKTQGQNVKKKSKFVRHKKAKESEQTIIQKLQEAYENIESGAVQHFSDFPLSKKTLQGLKDNGFTEPTEIQRESIGLALKGQDILGAAQTGSGKTLAFLIPILENLYCQQWTRVDGLGALVITPTRELAYQIFETLRKIGIHHDISAGLIIGGKDLQFEKKRMDTCNIVICTPGRLLQHMDENPLFDCNTMRVLVLDEADRCLDMGFERSMNAIIENLPAERQTMLFSATQTKSVRDLARLSLNDPMYVSVHENSKHSTPDSLQQSYIVCELNEKISVLWSFIKNHLKQKVIVFMSSCKQVKYHYELFCRLRPGTSVLQLQGSLHQLRRMSIYESFCGKSNAVLFATDIAARGLDFPQVNWVVQYDCPEDANTYIHRAGRTARYQKGGESLLILLPSEEEGMLEELNTKKIPINKIKVNPSKMQTPFRKIEALLARDTSLKESAQRAFVAYAKSVFLMKNKKIFDIHALNTDAYSVSLGLAVPPRIRFLQRLKKKVDETKASKLEKAFRKQDLSLLSALKSSKEESSDELSSEEESDEEKLLQGTLRGKAATNFNDVDSDSEGDVLQVKRRNHDLEGHDMIDLPDDNKLNEKKKAVTKAAMAKKILKKKIVANKKTVFDDEGAALVDNTREKVSDLAKEYEAENKGGIDIEKARLVLIEEDKADKQRFKEKMKEKRREEKRKLKLAKKGDVEEVQEIDEEEYVDEGEDEEAYDSGEDSGSGPDLSWLPDPDKVFGKRSQDSDDEAESASEVEAIHQPRPLKGKSKKAGNAKKKLKSSAIGHEEPLDTGLSLMEDEELALQFLKYQH